MIKIKSKKEYEKMKEILNEAENLGDITKELSSKLLETFNVLYNLVDKQIEVIQKQKELIIKQNEIIEKQQKEIKNK